LYGQLKKSSHDGTGVLGSFAVSMASQTTRLGKGSSVERGKRDVDYDKQVEKVVTVPNCVLKSL